MVTFEENRKKETREVDWERVVSEVRGSRKETRPASQQEGLRWGDAADGSVRWGGAPAPGWAVLRPQVSSRWVMVGAGD